MVLDDSELIPLLSHAFMPARTESYKPFLSESDFAGLSLSSMPQYPDTSQYYHSSPKPSTYPQLHTGSSPASATSNVFQTPSIKPSAAQSQNSTNISIDSYEAEVQREMKRRMAASKRNIYIQIGDPQCHMQADPAEGAEELNRRLKWAQQMILSNPALCAKACQLSGGKEGGAVGSSS